jgi:hypothetical protein
MDLLASDQAEELSVSLGVVGVGCGNHVAWHPDQEIASPCGRDLNPRVPALSRRGSKIAASGNHEVQMSPKAALKLSSVAIYFNGPEALAQPELAFTELHER